jgi:HSP20 family protein
MKEGDQMATMMRWDPFQDLRDAQDEMAQMTQMAQMSPRLAHALGLHGQPQGSGRATTTAWAPALDISERKDAYLVTVELPGVEVDDLQITLEDGLLTIQGERHFAHDSSEQQFHRVERRYGAFRRSITLPAHVMADGIEATVDNGVLQIMVPKMEEATPKRIQVRPGRADIPAASSGEDTTPS